jgi:hypothetical protein
MILAMASLNYDHSFIVLATVVEIVYYILRWFSSSTKRQADQMTLHLINHEGIHCTFHLSQCSLFWRPRSSERDPTEK